MPKSLDVLIGLAVVMLAISMAVTLFTQAITSLLNTDGKRLYEGLRSLLLQIDPQLKGIADELITAILTHPLTADSRGRLGSVIHRDEFTKLLLDLATGAGAQKLQPASKETLAKALAQNGIDNPSLVLAKIRSTAMELERDHPDWASSFRQDTAILREASSQFIAKLNGLFDQTIDRVSARFTAHVRVITVVCSVFVALVIQLDTVGIVNNLWMSDSLRNQMIASSIGLNQASIANQPSKIEGTEALHFQEDFKQNIQNLETLAANGLFLLPVSGPVWWHNWRVGKIPGIVLSALLLSLGAPFWYNVLKTLLRLRSQIADKDDAQRVTRQTSQADRGTGPTTFTGQQIESDKS
jgi:hypothetical protein